MYVDPTSAWVQAAHGAALRGECDSVAHTGAALYQANRMIHDTVFLADPPIAWCIEQVRMRYGY